MSDYLQNTIRELVRAGHTIREEIGPWAPSGLIRLNGGPELTQMQFLQVAEDLLGAGTESAPDGKNWQSERKVT